MTPPHDSLRRGKCSVTLLNETDILGQYLEKEVSSVCPRNGAGGGVGGVLGVSPPRGAPSPPR